MEQEQGGPILVRSADQQTEHENSPPPEPQQKRLSVSIPDDLLSRLTSDPPLLREKLNSFINALNTKITTVLPP